MDKTQCSTCGSEITEEDERTLVLIVELSPEDSDDEGRTIPAGRRTSTTATYCDICKGKEPYFKINNPWYLLQSGRADPSSGPASEDASYRSVQDKSLAARLTPEGNEHDGDESLADTKDAIYTAVPISNPRSKFHKISNPSPQAPSKIDVELRQKETLREFLGSPQSRGMRPQIRDAAKRWIAGGTQAEIAQAMGIDQSSVSRYIKIALDLAKKPA